MNRIKFIASAVFILGLVLISTEARPRYMRRYNADPYAKAQYKNKCTICHIGHGGAKNTAFGLDFAEEGKQFTPELRAMYPKFFKNN
jgi:hypothetical protein